jgi:hypothetical protein
MNTVERSVLIFGAAAIVASLGVAAEAQAQTAAPAVTPAPPPTPRTADGHPDLSGIWVAGGVNVASGADEQTFAGRGDSFVGFEADGGLFRTSDRNVPQYKPQYWDQLTDNEYNGNFDDPYVLCLPIGVPRMGAPAEIINIAGKAQVELFYQAGFTGYLGSYESWDVHRVIWTDNRPHNAAYVTYESANGDSVAHWDGDTLVIESVGFTDTTWLDKTGWIHGFNLKVTERLSRVGNTLTWNATVEDPDYLTQPWAMTPIVEQLNTNPDAFLPESYPCEVREPFVSHVRSG